MTEARYVPAVDGLRALSVLAVIGFHGELSQLSGGFLGVEVFFVVSGYLITSLLLLEQQDHGTISLPQFWLRRARRLLPAVWLLLLAALSASLTLAPDALAQTRSDAAAALLYLSNWWQVLQRHSYFMAAERPPLLQHLWSLAVEEQFYLAWPLLVAPLARRRRLWVFAAALLGAAGSALWMARLFDPTQDPTRVYVGSDTRMSGLLLGAALAASGLCPLAGDHSTNSAARVVKEALGVAGLAALLTAFVRFDSHALLLYRGGLVLVDVATCALLVALVAKTALAKTIGSRPCAWLGRRSYGLYLWHWPVFALTRADFDLPWGGLPLLALRLTLTFAISEVCYRFVEIPVRRGRLSAWLRDRPLAFGISALLVAFFSGVLLCVSGARLAHATNAPRSRARLGVTSAALAHAEPASSGAARARRVPNVTGGIPLNPAWPRTLTVLSDSVALALGKSLPLALPGWKVEILGRPALMVKQVVPEFLNARGVGSVVVVALAYNSLFERDRKNYQRWTEIWDRSAERLVSDLKACGAKKIVWVTLREPAPELVTDAGRDQFERYAWFFPYANERIRALAARHPELALADWEAVSNVPGLTKDLIHVSPAGASLMTETIAQAVLGPGAEP
jgi:peptidoglycan/LPS O-acetylase OafA/YrhL